MSMIETSTTDGPMPLYVSRPEGSPTAAIIIVQEAYGLTDHIKAVTDRAAAAGYLGVAPALFHRVGSPVVEYTDTPAAMELIRTLTDAGLTTDVGATLAWLAGEGIAAGRTAIVGFCMGGSVSYVMAARMPFLAAVTFYGGGIFQGRFGMPSMLDLVPYRKSPWLGLFGDLDQGIPVEQVEALRVALDGAVVPAQIVRYPEAKHGFHCDDRPAAYDEASATDGWSRTLSFIAEQLG
jgi:carboxymethylenebutenolidase